MTPIRFLLRADNHRPIINQLGLLECHGMDSGLPTSHANLEAEALAGGQSSGKHRGAEESSPPPPPPGHHLVQLG